MIPCTSLYRCISTKEFFWVGWTLFFQDQLSLDASRALLQSTGELKWTSYTTSSIYGNMSRNINLRNQYCFVECFFTEIQLMPLSRPVVSSHSCSNLQSRNNFKDGHFFSPEISKMYEFFVLEISQIGHLFTHT